MAGLAFRGVLFVAMLLPARGLPAGRPSWQERAKLARWLVHNSDYAISSTKCSSVHDGCAYVGQPFGDVVSISDGNGTQDSTGIIYTYLPPEDAATQDIMADPRMTLTFTEKALGCKTTAEDPPCARLTIAGNLTQVPAGAETDKALAYLFSRHPQMKAWSQAHNFKPYWMSKEDISSFFFIDFYGGAVGFTVDEYLKASPLEEERLLV
eukprot:TRINITY_DN64386_c0_g1_i1.p1 TRINITY_DN64386_c0_g1~~TRINITY_DN64386_c0_g1_i1.p1  ORF type:complete len:209 (-),score=47.16 TRINITY_DN64386_c0_g1_i1:56-682(-)